MSLTNFLLGAKPSGKKRAIDTELDAIFRSQTAENRPELSSNHTTKEHNSDVYLDEPDRKRSKPSPSVSLPSKKHASIALESVSEHVASLAEESESSDNPSTNGSDSEVSEYLDEDGQQPPTLIHETVQKDKRSPAPRKKKYAPSDETKERRDARTIFIGNLGSDVAVKRPLQKQLHRHILAFVPMAKIESARFRSVAFNLPTTSKPPKASSEGKKQKQVRQHERDRASSWRDANSVDESKTDEKKFLTAGQKKKIAFINRDIHSDADSVHAYIVFAYPLPHPRPANLPPLPPVMDPFQAARVAVEKCNGTTFLDRMLRVDSIVKQPMLAGPSDKMLPSSVIGDPKLSVFVGNLDFESKEEDLRIFFEGVVTAERGPPDSEDPDTPKCWVRRVRMIRDRGTQLGKGFAYVQFSDRICVDEILALEPGKLKLAKRKLRVQRCKSALKASSGKIDAPSAPKPAKTSNRVSMPAVPKGNPSLGEKLVKLNKEERKKVKAADADRVARRIAKKKARLALAKQGVPSGSKERQRVRRSGAARRLSGAPPKKTNRGRVRSEKSVAKRNAKK